jgi:two-component system, sensor histidine kinase and response regulator
MQSPSPLDTISETAPAAERSTAKPTLLIVDDEEGPRQSLKIVFKDEYNTLLASNGQTALELARTHSIDVAILDIMMVGLSGIEVLQLLKEYNPAIEVIILTAYETVDTARQAVRYDACEYLTKPFDIPTVRAAVTRAIEKHRKNVAAEGANEKLASLQEDLRNHQLEQEMVRMKGEIYASVLHDINSPLTVISGFVEMIHRSIENAAQVEGSKLENIKEDLTKLNTQVGRCFEISRRYLGFLRESSVDLPRVSVNQILADLKELLVKHPAIQGHQLTIDELADDVFAEINGTDLLQVLLNLTINALQSTNDLHQVEIRAQRIIYPLDLKQIQDTEEDRLINRGGFMNRAPLIAISVRDTGPGISPANMTRMFEENFTTKPAEIGTGLGLSIVKRLVKQADGAIHVHSKPGEGATFTVCLQAREG